MRPRGALTEEQRLELHWRYNGLTGDRINDRTRYAVMRDNGKLEAGDRFCFIWEPRSAYYFDNFWFAWAYHLQLKQSLNDK